MVSEKTTSDKIKESLNQDSKEHREAFEEELTDLLAKVKRITGAAVVIGGGFAFSYYMMKKLTGSKKVKYKKSGQGPINEVVVEKQPSVVSTIRNVILTEVAAFLLAIAKEKIVEYLDNLNTREDEDSKDAE